MTHRYMRYVPPKEKVFRALLHIPAGVLTILGATLGWEFGIICLVSFLIYEINEDKHIHDQAWLDIFGYLIGVNVAVLFLLVIG